jgi:outer membrane biosynthesis protein TonB
LATSWVELQRTNKRREFRSRLAASLGFHVALGLAFAFAPEATPRPLPPVLTVKLVAAPAPAPTARPRAAAAQPVRPKPRPKKIILPKKPPAVAKPPRRVVKPKPRPAPLEYEDALAQIRKELGETPDALPMEEESSELPVEDEALAGSQVSAAYLAWLNATKQHVRRTWVALEEFRDRDLVTCLRVDLTSSGDVLGEPSVVRGSGDPFWDDNAVRALVRASPIPAPPEPGERTFCLPSRERE